jgi:hypothetical protein
MNQAIGAPATVATHAASRKRRRRRRTAEARTARERAIALETFLLLGNGPRLSFKA